jgi:hypothetical protein
MSWLWAAVFFLLSTQVIAQTVNIPPDWIVRGFEAALADSRQEAGSAAVVNTGELAENVPPGERAEYVALLKKNAFETIGLFIRDECHASPVESAVKNILTTHQRKLGPFGQVGLFATGRRSA